LLIDCGYSNTTVTPLVNGRPVQQAIRRLDIGGKFLTNFLKEQITVTSVWDLTGDPYAVNTIKESMCFVSDDYRRDLDKSRWRHWDPSYGVLDPNIVVDYVLPDYETNFKGIVRPHDTVAAKRNVLLGPRSGPQEQVVTLGSERFSPPELLFNPSDIGMKEAGLPAVVMESIDAMPSGFQPAMLANVVLTGGTVQIPGFCERL
jgi:actin-related protein 6